MCYLCTKDIATIQDLACSNPGKEVVNAVCARLPNNRFELGPLAKDQWRLCQAQSQIHVLHTPIESLRRIDVNSGSRVDCMRHNYEETVTALNQSSSGSFELSVLHDLTGPMRNGRDAILVLFSRKT
jgi:hypothetical protein